MKTKFLWHFLRLYLDKLAMDHCPYVELTSALMIRPNIHIVLVSLHLYRRHSLSKSSNHLHNFSVLSITLAQKMKSTYFHQVTTCTALFCTRYKTISVPMACQCLLQQNQSTANTHLWAHLSWFFHVFWAYNIHRNTLNRLCNVFSAFSHVPKHNHSTKTSSERCSMQRGQLIAVIRAQYRHHTWTRKLEPILTNGLKIWVQSTK